MKNTYFRNVLLFLTAFCLLGTISFAQDKDKKKYKYEFCSSKNKSYDDRFYAKDLREMTMARTNSLKVESSNGRITVKGSDRNDILVRACVGAWRDSQAEAESVVKSIRVVTSPYVRSENTPKRNWSVSYEIHVPKSINLDLDTSNGRLTISSVRGTMNLETSNGRITLNDVSGEIKGRTSNGRITVNLSGNALNGKGIDVKTSNGRITLNLPSNYSANVYAETSNGRFRSDFSELQPPAKRNRWNRSYKVNGSINGGGATIRAVTSNGRITISSK